MACRRPHPSPANTRFWCQFLGARALAHARKARGIAILVLALVAALVMTPAQAQRPDPMSFGNPATSASIDNNGSAGPWRRPSRSGAQGRRSPGSRAPVPGVVSVGLDAATHAVCAERDQQHSGDRRWSCNARRASWPCSPVTTVRAGDRPSDHPVDQVTHTMLVATSNVHDGRHCNAPHRPAGCGAATTGNRRPSPGYRDQPQHAHYIGNIVEEGAKRTVIDGSACNGSHRTGCAAPLGHDGHRSG